MTEHPLPGEQYLTSKGAALYLGVAIRTVGKMLETGRLVPTWKTMGGHARFTTEDLDKQRIAEAERLAARARRRPFAGRSE